MSQLMVIAGVAVLVLVIAKQAQAQTVDTKSGEYASDPRNWYYMRGYTPGKGVIL